MLKKFKTELFEGDDENLTFSDIFARDFTLAAEKVIIKTDAQFDFSLCVGKGKNELPIFGHYEMVSLTIEKYEKDTK